MIILIILSSSWHSAEGYETLQHVKTRGRLCVGVRTDSPPFGYVDLKGRNAGLDVDIARRLARELFGNGDSVDFKPVTSENENRVLKTGEVDVVIATASVSGERMKVADFSVPYFVSGDLILEREGDSIYGSDSLHGKTIAMVEGTSDDALVCNPAFGATCVTFRTVPEAIRAVRERRTDVLIDDDAILIEIAKQNRDMRIAGWRPFSIHYYRAEVRKGDVAWLGFINSTLTRMKNGSAYRSLLCKWFGMLRGHLYEKELLSYEKEPPS
jgi:ABC-type amino acid transport substrate-binding protein